MNICKTAHHLLSMYYFAFALSLSPVKRRVLAEFQFLDDCYFVYRILLVSEFIAEDGYYKYNDEYLEHYTASCYHTATVANVY